MIQSHELWMWFRAFVQSICSSILLQHLFPRLFHQLFELCKPIPPSSRHIKAIASIVFSLDGQRQSMKAIKTVHLIPSLLEAPEFNFWYRITGSRKFSKVFESFWNPRKEKPTTKRRTSYLYSSSSSISHWSCTRLIHTYSSLSLPVKRFPSDSLGIKNVFSHLFHHRTILTENHWSSILI